MCAAQLNLSNNQLCGLDRWGDGTFTAEGITALAESLKVTASMTRLDVRQNLIGEESKAALHEAFEGRSGFELLL